MSAITAFEDLESWQCARRLTNEIYRLTQQDAFSRDYGLKDQIQRAAVSVMSNIAEGFERRSDKSFLSFLAIAKGSAGEVRSQLYVALDMGYITNEQFAHCGDMATRTGKLVSGLMQYLQRSLSRPTCPPFYLNPTISDLRPLTIDLRP